MRPRQVLMSVISSPRSLSHSVVVNVLAGVVIIVVILLLSNNGPASLPLKKGQILAPIQQEFSLPTNKSARTKTLVMCVQYPGQQGSGALCISTLQCFLSSIYNDFNIVEPYFHHSHFRHRKSLLRFSSIFDFEWFTSESNRVHYTGMMPIEEFKQLESNSQLHHRYIIFVQVNWSHKSSKQKIVWYSNDSLIRDQVNCLTPQNSGLSKDYIKLFNYAKSRLGKTWSRRCVVRMLELEITRGEEYIMPPKPVDSLFKFIFDIWPPGDVLLVFSRWPKAFIPVNDPVSGIHCLQEYLNTKTVFRKQFEPSQRLLKAAEIYEQLYLHGKNHLAIMCRVERVVTGYLQEKTNKGKTLDDCFDQVLTIKAKMDENFTESSTPLVTLDIGGKYGTVTYDDHAVHTHTINITEEVVKDLYKNKSWSIAEWENSFTSVTEGEKDPGYVAALQRLLASRADCMILLGGGDFQAFAVTDYLQFHKNTAKRCIEVVCSISVGNNEVQNTLDLNSES